MDHRGGHGDRCGAPPPNAANFAQARALAERAAQVGAVRKVVENVIVTRDVPPPPSDSGGRTNPILYALVIGVSQYQRADLQLRFPAKDAEDFAAVLRTQKGGLYRDVVVQVLTEERATKDAILDGLDWLTHETTSRDVAMLFFAGSAAVDANGRVYLLPVNAQPDKLRRTGVSQTEVKETIEALPGATLVFLDTCFGDRLLGRRRGVAEVAEPSPLAEGVAVVFAAAGGRQQPCAIEDPQWGNGAFTKALVEGLTGKANSTGRGRITVNMLELYLSERVKELTGGKQTPTTTKPQTIQDFPVALRP